MAEHADDMTETTQLTRRTSEGAGGGTVCPPKVAFIVSQFPETHETFILREFVALAAHGLDFVILSLKPCRDRVIQTAAVPFMDRTYYPSGRMPCGSHAVKIPGAIFRTRAALAWARRPLECAYVAWASARLGRLARTLGVSHIHAHWATAPTSAAVILSRVLNVPYSFTAHAWDIYAGDGRLAAKAGRAAFVATCTRANAAHIRSLLPSADGDKVLVNYHGVPAATVSKPGKAREGTLRIAAVGRLVETKGFEYLLEALGGCDFPFSLVIVGDGPLRGKLEMMARRQNLAGSVRFAGTVPNEEVFRILADSDAFVMPSVIAGNGDRDGIPNVLLEAMSVGLPVVASRISGIPEAVIDGQTGILVPEKDVSVLRAMLGALDRDRRLAARMGAAGLRLVGERFNAETNARGLFEIFSQYAGRRLE